MLKDIKAMIDLRFEMKSNDDARNESLSYNRISHQHANELQEEFFCALSRHHAGEIYLSAFIIHTRYARRREMVSIAHQTHLRAKMKNFFREEV